MEEKILLIGTIVSLLTLVFVVFNALKVGIKSLKKWEKQNKD